MQVMATTLLTGPYDWDPSLLPRSEFEQRLGKIQREFTARGATALLVYGDTLEHSALTYLTGFTPKMGPAFVLVPPQGGVLRLATAGGIEMLVAAKRLTWVEDVISIRGANEIVAGWLKEKSRGVAPVLGIWGMFDMSREFAAMLQTTMEPLGRIISLEEVLDVAKVRKSPLEQDLLRRSGLILTAGTNELTAAVKAGAAPRNAALAAERAAYRQGAQDVRVLVSARNGGPPLPPDGTLEDRPDPLLAVVAVRYAGYWAEGLITVTSKRNAALERTEAARTALVHAVRAGVSGAGLFRMAHTGIEPFPPHAATVRSIGNGIGLSLEERPILTETNLDQLEEDGVYSLRLGAAGEGTDNAILSVMILVKSTEAEVLWPPELTAATTD